MFCPCCDMQLRLTQSNKEGSKDLDKKEDLHGQSIKKYLVIQ
jgi:hypothetical protein